jgi:putative peptidoglycan lipid II flippase
MPDPEPGRRSLSRGAAATTTATLVSRITGFVRVVVVAAAMGTTFLANTYQTANTAPNVLFELVAAGVLTSVFVPTFVEYIVNDRKDEGWEAANALTSVAIIGLVALAVILGLVAPLVMRLFTLGVQDGRIRNAEIGLGTTFLRLFAPQVVFYGVGMIMSAALNAHRRFGLPAAAPICNNIVVIGVYLAYAVLRSGQPPSVTAITTGEAWLLGIGTTAGVVAMTIVLIPQLRRMGWHFRFTWHPGHPAVGRALRLGVWALGYAGGYQAGLVVVLFLANRVRGGVAAYQWAYAFFYLPHALFAIPVFNVLFTAMSEHVARDEVHSFGERMRDGLGMLTFILLPVAAALLVVSGPLSTVTLYYGAMDAGGAALVGRVLLGFALGLPAYSVFLTLTRGFYAIGDTRTPTLINAFAVVLSSVLGTILFFVLPSGWEVAGLSLGHSIGFLIGALIVVTLFHRRVQPLLSHPLKSSLRRSALWTGAALVAMLLVRYIVPAEGRLWSLLSLLATVAAGTSVYVLGMVRSNAPEIERVSRLISGYRAGRVA